MTRGFTSPVVIIGAGPVGLTLAMDLAWRGVMSLVVERRLHQPVNPKCNTTNARSMEIFRRLGCADAIRKQGLPAEHPTDVVYMTRMNSHELTRYHLPPRTLVRATTGSIDDGWPTPEPQHRISQLYLEPILRDHTRDRYHVDIWEGWELVSFTEQPSGVQVIVCNLASGEERSLNTRYLVGCDGADSSVQKMIGAKLQGIPEIEKVCSSYVRAKRIGEINAKHPAWMYRMMGSGRMNIALTIDGDQKWLFHTVMGPGDHLDTFDAESEIFAAVGEKFEYELLGQERWTARAMVANKYRHGNVFLAGDAAHIWVPMGGFGMNAGIADAEHLGWLLGGVIGGWLNPAILDAYEIERAPIGNLMEHEAAQMSADLSRAMSLDPRLNDDSAEGVALRAEVGARIAATNTSEFNSVGMQLGYYYLNSPIICSDGPPPAFKLDTYQESSVPGVRAPHFFLADGSSLYDHLGRGLTLLRIGTNSPTGDTFAAAAKAANIPFARLDLADDSAVKKYEGYSLVLVRPDHHIVWRGREAVSAERAGEILRRVTGHEIVKKKMVEVQAQPLRSAPFLFGQGTRWHNGKLYFSDMIGEQVMSFDPATQKTEVIVKVPHRPNGLGFLSDGTLLINSTMNARILAFKDGRLDEYIDLSKLVRGDLSDMAVSGNDCVYIGETASRVLEGEPPGSGSLIFIDAQRNATTFQTGLMFPNGLVISADGKTLYNGESFACHVSQYRIEANGLPIERRLFADLGGKFCNGLGHDPADGVWVCCPGSNGEVQRYDSRGIRTHVVHIDGEPMACAYGGNDNQTLFIVGIEALPEGANLFESMAQKLTVGKLWSATVAVA